MADVKPRRVQRKRTKGWRMPEGTVYVGRGSKWGNPWIVDPAKSTTPPTNQYRESATECVRLYHDWLKYAASIHADLDAARAELAGKNLACWCPLDQPCHADVLLDVANGGT